MDKQTIKRAVTVRINSTAHDEYALIDGNG